MSNHEDYPEDARARAVRSLRKKAEFRSHLLAYVVVNTAIVIVWVMTGSGFFWPMFPILGWGIGLLFHGQDAYGRQEITEADIRREMERQR
jgi:2TM domain